MPSQVSLRQVTKIFPAAHGRPPVHAVGPVDIELERGEFFAVVGPSGCGKSTLFELIAGLSAPTTGTVSFEGRPIGNEVPEGVGVVFQEDATFPWLTIRKNIEFGLLGLGLSSGECKSRVGKVLDLTSLQDFEKHYPAQLSGGMRQRVCIARTLVKQPRLILLDEPFAALDQQTRLLMGDEVLRLWRQTGATILLITHALDEAVMLADRVAVMSARPGTLIDVIATGWPRERDSRIIEDERFGAVTARVWRTLREEAFKTGAHQ